MVRVEEILVEHYQRRDTIGIAVPNPRLSWRVVETGDNWIQEQFELAVTDAEGKPLYECIKQTRQSILVEWPFHSLQSRETVNIAVRVKGTKDDRWSEWSDVTIVELALINNSDFNAQFVSASDVKQTQTKEALFRKEFSLGTMRTVKARLYSAAKGVYEIEINGTKVGDHLLSPGWTSYTHRLVQRVDDVQKLLITGTNTIGIRLADGWFSGFIGMDGGDTNIYGDTNMALAQLEITYEDGTSSQLCTDSSWLWQTGPITFASIYNGESYDANLEVANWSGPASIDLSNWNKVSVHKIDVPIVPSLGPPIRCTEVLKPVKLFKSKTGKTIIDFGQNFAGVTRLNKVKGPKGHIITLRHAEVMEDDELGVRPLRLAQNKDAYVLKGDPYGETWSPRFTHHGFRYVQIDGYPGEISLDSIDGIVFHSDFERTGWFECSDSRLNKLHQNVCWSMRSNFMSVPTDCPQRDERLGWTGDILLFGPTANYLYRCQGFLQNWLVDLASEQKEYGIPQVVCPSPFRKYENFWKGKPVAAWQDAAVLVPWQIYQETGDKQILEAQYESMVKWLEEIPKDDQGLFWNADFFQCGDWLDPDAPPENPAKAKTDPQYVANAYLIQSTEVLAKVASLLEESEDSAHYNQLTSKLRERFSTEYLTKTGRPTNFSQTAYALAVVYGLLDGTQGSLWKENSPERLKQAGTDLARIVTMDRFRIGTGFVGTPVICDALERTGNIDIAYKMLLNDANPSWLYPISMGATTTWERWDSMLPNGKINPGEMTSFNHYAFGAIADWMHRTIGGLTSLSPGWEQVLVKPLPGGGITEAKVEHDSLFGKITCGWKITGPNMEVNVSIPANVSASVDLPDGKKYNIGSGDHSFTSIVKV